MDTTAATPPTRGYTATKDDLQKRLRRIEGQVRGLQRMVDDDTYCIDVLTQVAAVTKALQGVALGLLDDHLRHCVTEAIREGEDGDADKVAEAMGAVRAAAPVVTAVAERLTAHLRSQLGAWPPSGGVLVTTSPERERPGWDGLVRSVAGLASPAGAVLSVPAEAVAPLRAAGDQLADVEAAMPEVLGRPGARLVRSILRWTAEPAELPPLGEEVDAGDPRVPEWLRPFGGDVLLLLDDDGRYLAGVGRKRHDDWCTELAVGTEPEARGRGAARRLVATAARRVLDEGKVPTYQHDADNVASARVADAVGFPDAGLRGLWLVC